MKLKEQATLSDVTGGKVRIRLINEGQGSSGFYAGEMLETYGPAAFPKGTFLYFNHENPESRDIRDAFGATLEDAVFEDENKGLWAEAEIFSSHQTFIKEIAKYAALSIEATGERDENENITELTPNPFNAVALVSRGGRDGKIAEILESAEYANVVNNETQRKDAGMTPEDIQKIVEALSAALAGEFAKITEALKPAEPEPVNEDAIDPADVAEALISAELPKSARKRVFKAMESGVSLEEAIKDEAEYITELRGSVEQNRVVAGTSDFDFSVTGWGK